MNKGHQCNKAKGGTNSLPLLLPLPLTKRAGPIREREREREEERVGQVFGFALWTSLTLYPLRCSNIAREKKRWFLGPATSSSLYECQA